MILIIAVQTSTSEAAKWQDAGLGDDVVFYYYVRFAIGPETASAPQPLCSVTEIFKVTLRAARQTRLPGRPSSGPGGTWIWWDNDCAGSSAVRFDRLSWWTKAIRYAQLYISMYAHGGNQNKKNKKLKNKSDRPTLVRMSEVTRNNYLILGGLMGSGKVVLDQGVVRLLVFDLPGTRTRRILFLFYGITLWRHLDE